MESNRLRQILTCPYGEHGARVECLVYVDGADVDRVLESEVDVVVVEPVHAAVEMAVDAVKHGAARGLKEG